MFQRLGVSIRVSSVCVHGAQEVRHRELVRVGGTAKHGRLLSKFSAAGVNLVHEVVPVSEDVVSQVAIEAVLHHYQLLFSVETCKQRLKVLENK